MSNVYEAIAWAIRVSKGEPMPARMLLIVGLAPRVNDSNGFLVWPSIRQISDDTDMSESSVRRWLKHLAGVGLIEIFTATRSNGATSSNRYKLPIQAVFYHPTKGAMPERAGVKSEGGEGVNLTGGGVRLGDRGGVSPGDRGNELQSEQQLEDSTGDELPLGIPPIPPKDPTPAEVGAFIAGHWELAAEHFGATPLRGGKVSEANAERARDLGREFALDGCSAIDVWREIMTRIGASDFLQGKVQPRGDRAPFKLSLSFLLEKRNFVKVLEGRFDGRASGEPRRGSTSEATGNVLKRLRPGGDERAGGGNQALAHTGR
jgi:hypothetical protein